MDFHRPKPTEPKLLAAFDQLLDTVACSGRTHCTTTRLNEISAQHGIDWLELSEAWSAYHKAEADYWRAQFDAEKAKPRTAPKKPVMTLNDREIEITEVDGEIGEGAYASAGCYVDNGQDLNDEELDIVTDAYQEKLYDDFYQSMVCRSEAWADAREDR